MDALFYLFVFGLFVVALAIDFILIAGYFSYVEGTSLWARARRALAPLLPSELASALLAVGVAYLYVELGPSHRRPVRRRSDRLPVSDRSPAASPSSGPTSSRCAPSSWPASRSRC